MSPRDEVFDTTLIELARWNERIILLTSSVKVRIRHPIPSFFKTQWLQSHDLVVLWCDSRPKNLSVVTTGVLLPHCLQKLKKCCFSWGISMNRHTRCVLFHSVGSYTENTSRFSKLLPLLVELGIKHLSAYGCTSKCQTKEFFSLFWLHCELLMM